MKANIPLYPVALPGKKQKAPLTVVLRPAREPEKVFLNPFGTAFDIKDKNA